MPEETESGRSDETGPPADRKTKQAFTVIALTVAAATAIAIIA